MKKLTIEQLQVMEALSDKQYTLNGAERKTFRTPDQSRKLGLVNEDTQWLDDLEQCELLDVWDAEGLSDVEVEKLAIVKGFSRERITAMFNYIHDLYKESQDDYTALTK